MSENSIQNKSLFAQQTARPSGTGPSTPAPKLPTELLEKVIDCLGSRDLLHNMRVSKQWQALSMRTSRLQRHVADQGSFGKASSHPEILLPQLASIMRTKANLAGGRVTGRIERPLLPQNLGLVEVAGEMYRVLNTQNERDAVRSSYPVGEQFDSQSRLRAGHESAAPGEVALAQVTTPYVLKRCGLEGRYLPAPSFPTLPQASYCFAQDLRFFAATSDGATLMTQQGDDVATRTTQPLAGRLKSMTYVDAHLLLVSDHNVRVLDAKDGHREIFSIAPHQMTSAKISRDGRILVVCCRGNSNERTFQFFDTSNGRMLNEWFVEAAPFIYRRHDVFAFDPSGRFLISTIPPRKLAIYDVHTGRALVVDANIGAHDSIMTVCFSPIKNIIAVGTAIGDILIFKKIEDRLERLTHMFHDHYVGLNYARSMRFNDAGTGLFEINGSGLLKSIDLRGSAKKSASLRDALKEVSRLVAQPLGRSQKTLQWLRTEIGRMASSVVLAVGNVVARVGSWMAWCLDASTIPALTKRLFRSSSS